MDVPSPPHRGGRPRRGRCHIGGCRSGRESPRHGGCQLRSAPRIGQRSDAIQAAGDDDVAPTPIRRRTSSHRRRPSNDRSTPSWPRRRPHLLWRRPRRPTSPPRQPLPPTRRSPSTDRSDPTAYAIAFATELLDTNYATQTRAELLAWAEHEEAPNTLPGVPASVAGKSLVLSLADPGLPGGTPSPTPSAGQWAANAEEGVTQSVDNVEAEVDPDWAQIIAEGWQPRDPRMTIETVTGTVTVTTNGQAATPESFSLTLTLGTAAHVPAGYGAVAAADWTVD